MIERYIQKDKLQNLEIFKSLSYQECNFIGMGMFDSLNLEKLLRSGKYKYYERDEKKIFIKRFPLIIALDIDLAEAEYVLNHYWTDETMERRILIFYTKKKTYGDEKIRTEKEIDFVYDSDFVFAIENVPESDGDEYLVSYDENVRELAEILDKLAV